MAPPRQGLRCLAVALLATCLFILHLNVTMTNQRFLPSPAAAPPSHRPVARRRRRPRHNPLDSLLYKNRSVQCHIPSFPRQPTFGGRSPTARQQPLCQRGQQPSLPQSQTRFARLSAAGLLLFPGCPAHLQPVRGYTFTHPQDRAGWRAYSGRQPVQVKGRGVERVWVRCGPALDVLVFVERREDLAARAAAAAGAGASPTNVLVILLDALSGVDGTVERTFPITTALLRRFHHQAPSRGSPASDEPDPTAHTKAQTHTNTKTKTRTKTKTQPSSSFSQEPSSPLSPSHTHYRFSRFQSVRSWTDPNYVALVSGRQLCVGDGKACSGRGVQGAPLWPYPQWHNFPANSNPPASPRDLKALHEKNHFHCPECLWSVMEEAGYVGAHLVDHGDNERTTGLFGMLDRNAQRPLHHVVQQVYAEGSVSGQGGDECIGGQPIDEPLFDYAKAFFDAYGDVGRFLFLHTCIGHDDRDRFVG